MRTILKLMTVMGGGGGLNVLYRDDLTTTDDSPMTSPLVASHIGSMTLTQTDGTIAIASQEWTWTAQATPVFGDLKAVDDITRAHAAGRTIATTINWSSFGTNGNAVIWSDKNTPATPANDALAGFQIGSVVIAFDNKVVTDLGATTSLISLGVDYRAFSIRRASGGSFFVLNGKLEWVGETGTADAWMEVTNNNGAFKVKERLVMFDMTSMFTTRWGDALTHVASPANPQTFAHQADGLIEFTWLCGTNETLDIQFRKTDADNYWICRSSESGNTIKLIQVIATVEQADADSDAQTYNNATSYRIVIKLNGSSIRTFVNGTQRNVITNVANQAATAGQVSGFASGSNLAVWARAVSPQYPF